MEVRGCRGAQPGQPRGRSPGIAPMTSTHSPGAGGAPGYLLTPGTMPACQLRGDTWLPPALPCSLSSLMKLSLEEAVCHPGHCDWSWGQERGTTRAEHPLGWDGEALKRTGTPLQSRIKVGGQAHSPCGPGDSCWPQHRVPMVPPGARILPPHSVGAQSGAGTREREGRWKMNGGVERLMALSGK